VSSEECRRTALSQHRRPPPYPALIPPLHPSRTLVAANCSAGRASHTALHIQPVTFAYRLQAGRAFREPIVPLASA
jgi:hypothetical protein